MSAEFSRPRAPASSRSSVEPLRKPRSSVVQEGPGGCKAALCRDDAAWCGPEGAQRCAAHSVDGQLVLLLDLLSSILGELRCVEHGSLDDRCLEAPCRRRGDPALTMRRSLASAWRIFPIRRRRSSARLSVELSQMSNHRVAPRLNTTRCVPTRTSLSQRRCFRRLEKRMASVSYASKRTTLSSAHLRLVAAHRSSLLVTSSMSVPWTIQVTSPMKEMPRLSE